MSLHKFAEQVAQHGRGDDSLLVHMTPDEVQRLQKFAEANGRSLTINPTTGLPEAGMLSDLFKAVAPIALGAFLGPAGMGLTIGGLSSAATAGLLTGGITTLATGSLSRGLMAGLGAYGGAGLGEGLANAGIQSEVAANMPTLAGQAPEQVAEYASKVNAVRDTAMSNVKAMPFMDKMSSGIAAAADNPMNFAKQNWMPLAAAAAPIMAGAMVPTTTSMPASGNTGFIRQKIVNPDGTVRDLTPVKASEWGSRNFSDVYRGYKGGGIVALAGGGTGVPTYFVENPDVAKAYTENTYGLTPEQFAYTHYEKYGKAEMAPDAQGNVARAPTTQSAGAAYAATHGIDLQKNIDEWIVNNPFATAADVTKALSGSGLTQEDVNPYLTASTNLSDAQRYALSHLDEIDGLSGLQKGVLTALARNPNMTQSEIDAAQAQYRLSDYDIQSPLIHGYQVANDQEAAAQKYIADNPDVARWISSAEGQAYLKANPQFDAKDIAYTHYQRYGEDEGRKWGVTKVVPPPPITITPGETQLSGAVVYDNGAYGNYGNNTGNPLTSTPGDIIRNPDGTATVVPNIPGRPYGGFPGMKSVRDAYTAGGGSLGYTAKAPKTMAEFNEMFNKQTGDSLAAYNYLMGKGAYPTKSGVGEISRPYREATLGYPESTNKMYNWDPVAGKMVRNPDYVAPGRDADGNVTYGMSLNDIKKALSDKPLEGQALYDWAMTNNLSAQDIADATGMKLSEVYSQFRTASQAAAKKKKDDAAAGITTLVDTSTGGDDGGDGGDGGGDGGGNGSGAASGDCVDPNVHILLADGGTVRAGDLKVGDMLHTLHEKTFVYGDFPVEYLNILQRPKVEALFDDGQKIIISITHKFLTADGQWEKISDMEIGTAVRGIGDVTKKLVSTTDMGVGPVVEMVVTEAHTYISEGLASHNKYYGGLIRGKANGGMAYAMGGYAVGGGLGSLGSYSDGGRLLRGPGDGVSDSIPATIGVKQQPARLADGEFVIPARIVSELGNGSTDAGAKKLYAMMDRVQKARSKTTGKNKIAANSRADKYLPA